MEKWIFIEYANIHSQNLLAVSYFTDFNKMKNHSANQSSYYKEKGFSEYNSNYYKIEDNPVPSLDNKLYSIKQLKQSFQSGSIVMQNLLNRKINKKQFNLEKEFKYFLEKVLLQNGVETNNG